MSVFQITMGREVLLKIVFGVQEFVLVVQLSKPW